MFLHYGLHTAFHNTLKVEKCYVLPMAFIVVFTLNDPGIILEVLGRNFVFVANFHTPEKSPNFKTQLDK